MGMELDLQVLPKFHQQSCRWKSPNPLQPQHLSSIAFTCKPFLVNRIITFERIRNEVKYEESYLTFLKINSVKVFDSEKGNLRDRRTNRIEPFWDQATKRVKLRSSR
jgi:hypothetical protein